MSEAKDTKPGYLFQFSADLGSGRGIQVSGNFSVGATLEDMNDEFDKVRAALDRQQAKSAVPAIEFEIAKNKATLDAIKADLAGLDDSNKGKVIPTSEKSARESMKSSIRNLEAKISQLNSDLEKTKQEAA